MPGYPSYVLSGFCFICAKKNGTETVKKKKIDEIILPYKEGTPLYPSVTIGDKIIHAVELMVAHNQQHIAVVRNRRPVGMLYLEDAFNKLGLQLPKK